MYVLELILAMAPEKRCRLTLSEALSLLKFSLDEYYRTSVGQIML